MATPSLSPKEWFEKSVKGGDITSLELDKIEAGEKLGDGAFGQVYKAKISLEGTDTIVAVKVFKSPFEERADEEAQDDLIREVKLLCTVGSHPNILSFYGVSKDPETKTYHRLVLEYADGGSLRDYLKNNNTLSGNKKLRFAKEIASGVACLHEKNILHRDLNSANILVHKGQIKIADFGLSKEIKTEAAIGSIIHGHLQYIDPQCFTKMEYVRSKKSDIFSIGVVFWELSSLRIPFSYLDNTKIVAHIINSAREAPIDGTPQRFIDLYTKCWDQKPENRPEIGEVRETLEEIEWETSATPTRAVSSEDQKNVDISTTISQKLGEISLTGEKNSDD